MLTVPFQGRIDHFSWSPKTNIATLNPVIEFSICDNNGNLIMCYNELNKEIDLNQSNNLKTNVNYNFIFHEMLFFISIYYYYYHYLRILKLKLI